MRRILVRLLVACTVAAVVLVPLPAQAAPVPATPKLIAGNDGYGTILIWTAAGASMFQIQQASNATFTRNVRNYADRDGRDRIFAPPNLVTGQTYYFRIRGANSSYKGRFSAAVKVTVKPRFQPLRVMSYNVLTNLADGTVVGNERVAPWSQRAPKVVEYVQQGDPDIVALQEASGWIAEVKGPRQVDDLVSRLGGEYAMAQTEKVPGTPGWYRTGRYILYKPSVYTPVGAGGHWNIGNNRWAAYQVFRHSTTGADLLFVSYHLSPGGKAADAAREVEMRNLVTLAKRHSVAHGRASIVYAGDANSHDGLNHAFDGPGNATRAAKVADAFKVSPVRNYGHVNSANQYRRSPPMDARSIDRVFAGPGVVVNTWRIMFHHAKGKFVGVIPSDHNPLLVGLAIPY